MIKYGLCLVILITLASTLFANEIKTDITNKSKTPPPPELNMLFVVNQLSIKPGDVQSIELMRDGVGQPVVDIILTQNKSDELFSSSSNQVNNVLAFVWNKNIISYARIQSPLGNRLLVSGIAEEDAKRLVEAFKQAKR